MKNAASASEGDHSVVCLPPDQPLHSRSTALPYLWMLCGSLAFAFMASLAHGLGRSCGWQIAAISRCLVPLLLVAPWAVAADARLVVWKPASLWLRSLAGSMSMIGTFFALSRLPVSDVMTLTNTFPIWVAVLSWPLLRERPTAGVAVLVACGVAGVALIEQPHVAQGNFAALIALGCAVATAFAMIGLHRLAGLDARAIVVHFSAVALMFCLGAFFVFDRPSLKDGWWTGGTGWTLLGIGVAATVGQLFLTKAFAAGPPARVSVVGLTQIVFAAIFDRLLWERTFEWMTLAGMALVAAPTAWLLTHRGSGEPEALEDLSL